MEYESEPAASAISTPSDDHQTRQGSGEPSNCSLAEARRGCLYRDNLNVETARAKMHHRNRLADDAQRSF
ncbi:hypothetical protein N7537_008864 [Penicillium hordei]|uniref:Uncharacterized protein n=1 Tax=Penicillium hordei TaxID=40994 RepID=A0AAD6E1M0_9EURO|nr:uncharacterized protein N7537_008864 [Penicillium hordei]KAJ5598780.1 hypothetical protein N7537_008864 [Penicillium hordei]